MEKRSKMVVFLCSEKAVDFDAMDEKLKGLGEEAARVFQRWINSAVIHRVNPGNSIEITLPRWKEIVSVEGVGEIYEYQKRKILGLLKHTEKVRVGFFDFRRVFNHGGEERTFVIVNNSTKNQLIFMVKER